MTKTEAAETIAIQVEAFARRTQQPITRDAVWAHLSECAAGHRGEYLAEAAKLANHKTVLRVAIANVRRMDEHHLIGV